MKRAIFLFALTASPLFADSLTDILQSCSLANFGMGKYWLVQCLQEVFTAYPGHLTMGTIAPGAGTAAVGPSFTHILPLGNSEITVTSEALLSSDTSWLAQTQAVFAIPTLGLYLPRPSRSVGTHKGVSALLDQGDLDAKASVVLRARVYDAKQQWFYGLGPNTSLGGESEYSEKQFEVRAGVNDPLTSWLSAGFNADFVRPRIVEANSGTPLTTLYNNATAPGLYTKDEFGRFEPYLQVKIPPHRSISTVGRVGFAFFDAVGDAQYSFRRLSASDVTSIPLRVPVRPPKTADKRSGVANFFCPSMRSGAHCSAGDLSLIGRVDATFASPGRQAPFFLDPTLGGQDLQGNDTLRGFGDYRFRAPNRLLFQAEYRHPIWAVLGLVVFYDVGKVALQASDLSLGQFRHDLGLGLDVSVGNHLVARLYAAFGTGEPVQVQPRFGGLLQ